MSQITIDLPDEILAQLAVDANADDVTLSAFVSDLLADYTAIRPTVEQLETVSLSGDPKLTRPPIPVSPQQDSEPTNAPTKQQTGGTSPVKHRSQGVPLYNKREKNTWKI